MKTKQSDLCSFLSSPSSTSPSNTSKKRPLPSLRKRRASETESSSLSLSVSDKQEIYSNTKHFKKIKNEQNTDSVEIRNLVYPNNCHNTTNEPEHESFQEARLIYGNIQSFLSSLTLRNTKKSSRLFKLTPNGQSWLIYISKYKPSQRPQGNFFKLSLPPSESYSQKVDSFESQWDTHPTIKKCLGSIYGRICYENRWSQSYGVSYSYSGYKEAQNAKMKSAGIHCDSDTTKKDESHRPIKDDPILEEFIQDIHTHFLSTSSSQIQSPSINHELLFPNCSINMRKRYYNGCLKNWYLPEHTLSAHSDNERQMRPNSPIFSLSWGGPRRFCIMPKTNKKTSPEASSKESVNKLEIMIHDGDLIVMGGSMQQTHVHEIPKWRKTKDPPTSRRINWTVREFLL